MIGSADIRQQFLDFFKAKGHTIVPSAPIVIKDDPTLMFTNAGMNQFKDYFLGNKIPPHKRVADTQKCLRVSGKHNDLEEVGVDTYHHTMFEMLGNWSFGDYFKKEAIEWSWELLTEIYEITKDSLYVTVFEGDTAEQLPRDEESITIWKEIVGEERIVMGNKKDNFWEMGDTGPCGPCTEIHMDCRSEEERKNTDGKSLVNKDDPQVIEIWNNVFIEYNRKRDGSLEPLPAKHVDTGMGFERLVRVIQNKQSNYDTDVFSGTIDEVEKLSGKKYDHSDSKQDVAFRVIADHIRAVAFPIADGQLPSNAGAGYVIRRVLRRAVRYYFSYLNVKQPLLFKLVTRLSQQFKNVFPELDKQGDFIRKVIKEEEDAFLRTLEKGLIALEKNQDDISGEDAFKLYDTYGFPIDLTKLVAAEKNLQVDEEGFNSEMQKQKQRSRAATAVDTEDWVIVSENGSSKFVGYNTLETESKIVKYRKTKSQGKELYQIVLDKTPFYAESGGQVGDKGELIFLPGNGGRLQITDTKKENDLIIHYAQKLPEKISAELVAKVDTEKRNSTQVHHTATHLMHAALRKVLGTHVAQKGSLVNDEHLRFDFSHFAKVTDEELSKIEALVNEKIRQNIPLVIKQLKKDEAISMGAMALFGEKYGDIVRVVIIDQQYSIELCGGTHVNNTGELGFFKIKSESAVGAGIRRIEAVSGKAAEEFINEQLMTIRAIRETMKNPKDVIKSIWNLIVENGELKKQLEGLEGKQESQLKNKLLQNIEITDGVNFIGQIVEVSNADALKKICFSLKNDLKDYFIVLASAINNKAHVAIMIDETIAYSKNLDAQKIIKETIAPLIKGGGGGQKTLATAGGQDIANLPAIIEKTRKLL
jgi:alanyl-tRNA synthetase